MTVFEKISSSLSMIKFAHTVFALPFALTAMCLASRATHGTVWPRPKVIFLILLACYAARTAAMTFNRIADRELDGRNPRTAQRELVTGELSVSFAKIFLIVHGVIFQLAAQGLNVLAQLLAPVCMFVLLLYSLTKRFTWASHFFLGAALGLAPVGAWIAVDGAGALQHAEPFLLGLAVLLWVAGFDVIYSCQDFEFDTETGLQSIPSRFGLGGALLLARLIHALAFATFAGFWKVAGLGGFTACGLMLLGLTLAWEHGLVSPQDRSRINVAFFNLNGFISIVFFCFVLLDLAL